jgi:ATP-dependent exoDNAse (exonuclease V) alpha subunit
VRFERAYRSIGVEKGGYYTVKGINREACTVELTDGGGRSLAWQPDRMTRVEVYQQERRELALGDQIRWTRNDRSEQRQNGHVGRVVRLNDVHAAVMVDGKVQDFDLRSWRHWEHAYASTVHAAQGRTADAVVLHIDSERSQVVGHESWYVALSRARDGIRVFTDDVARLPEVIQKSMAQQIGLEARAPKLELTLERTVGRGFGRGM